MPEMKNNFQKGRMNKDLDERLVPNGEYRDALNVEIATSNDSDMGTLQTLKGNTFLGVDGVEGVCIGSIADDKNDKLYFMVAGGGDGIDRIIEYNYKDKEFLPVCIDLYSNTGRRALNFNEDFLITGINIIEDLLFWTDNNSEPKKINITRGKLGSNPTDFSIHTKLMVRNLASNAPPNSYVVALDQNGGDVDIQEEHLTVIKEGPSAAPVLEMIDTLASGMNDGDGLAGGGEVSATVTNTSSLTFLDANGDFVDTFLTIKVGNTMDFLPGDFLNIYTTNDRGINVRVQIDTITNNDEFLVEIKSGNKEIEGQEDLTVELEQQNALFQFKFPRFAYRYKYEDGEYSCFSPFTEPAFIPGRFNYLPKEGYNLGMVNRLRRLAIKDFVHERSMAKDVVSIDILYKESNSPNIYSVKTVKRVAHDPSNWDAWNGNSAVTVADIGIPEDDGWRGITKGFLPITTEMIHGVLPANQLLRPWDNVPRKALAQEVIGNRLVYGNYLQNYDLKKNVSGYLPIPVLGPNNIKVDIKARSHSDPVGSVSPEELHAGNKTFLQYKPAKSVKTLRTYQVGVVYIDKYGRETPVFSEDKRGATGGESASESSVYINKTEADKRNQLIVNMKSNPPNWATHRKYFIKETSNEYYNLAMDRCYDAEDGNVWLSFPSAERNKVDEETYLILKKAHDGNKLIPEPAKYKIIAIENEAPRFIKLKNISMGAIQDDGTKLGLASEGFPFEDSFYILIDKTAFDLANWDEKLMSQDISQVFIRIKAVDAVSHWYRLKQVTLIASGVHYKLEVSKQFGPEMSITSPDNSWNNRVPNCTVEIVKRIPEDRAEFEGRFFVKILKDATIKTTVCPDVSLDADWVPVSSMPVQYIDPRALENNVGSAYLDDVNGNFYGQNKYDLSIDPQNSNYQTSSAPGISGDGRNYWRLVSKDTSTGSDIRNVSSGWFIDNVEAFRIYKGDMEGEINYISHQWNADENQWDEHPTCWDLTKNSQDWNNLNVLGLWTYGGTANNYLTHPDTKPPFGAGNKSLIQNADRGNGGKVAPSTGIDVASGIINLSYSGLNKQSETGQNDYPNGWTEAGAIHEQSVFNDVGKHGGDQAFIDKLTTPGTIWRWKEDPDQIMYKTVLNTDFSSGPYTEDEWNTENGSDIAGEMGVGLFNYAIMADYFLHTNHLLTWVEGDPKSRAKSDFVSRVIPDHEDFNLSWAQLVGGALAALPGLVLTAKLKCSMEEHNASASRKWTDPLLNNSWGEHMRFPMGVYDWDHQVNKRRRFAFKAEVYEDPNISGNSATNAVAGGLLGSGVHGYLPTNDPSLEPHFDHTATATLVYPPTHPTAGNTIPTVAPGIRNDGMCVGFANPIATGGSWTFDPNGTGPVANYSDEIPWQKQWDAGTTGNSSPMAGTVTWQIMEPFTEDPDRIPSKNPAIWETEPKEDVGLDIYHEVGQIYPNELSDETIEQFVGAVGEDINKNSYVQCWDPDPLVGSIALSWTNATGVVMSDVRILAASDNKVMLGTVDIDDTSATFGLVFPLNTGQPGHVTPTIGSYLMIWRADGSETEATVKSITPNATNTASWYELGGNPGELGVHNREVRLPWFNCYSFGNGVESDRIRDDYNQVTIDNGPKASTTLEEPYLEERRKNGFIWSGLYNSTSGVNDLNQFIQAEKITKDVNPSYGSIQKLFARDSDLVAFCEDRVLKVLANKDALYNADGNTNLISTDRVLGNIKPFVGDYGISLNPESFASDSYRSYFSDSSRGAILRLSQDGLTPISDLGMHDWFADRLALTEDNKIIGSFDDNKDEYNITLKTNEYNKFKARILGHQKGPGFPYEPGYKLIVTNSLAQLLSIGDVISGTGILQSTTVVGKLNLGGGMWEITISQIPNITFLGNYSGYGLVGGGEVTWDTILLIPNEDYKEYNVTLSYSEKSKGWISFKSWNQENGISLNNSYYTFSGGNMFQHHINETRNEFYGTQFDSSVDVLFNKIPGSIKSFSTLNYEGSQARITRDINNNPDYYDNFPKDGWYVKEMISNAQELGEMEFWDKEDKWFGQIKGVKTEWLDDGTAGNIDPREFSYQGIGNAGSIFCPDCPEVTSWDCVGNTCEVVVGTGGQYQTEQLCLDDGCGVPESWTCYDGNCINPGDGSGAYSTYCDCVTLTPTSQSTSKAAAPQSFCCNEGEAWLYTCQNILSPTTLVYGCMDDGITNDPFITQQRPNGWVGPATNHSLPANVSDCSCIYTVVESWDCVNGICVDPGTGQGQYATLSACNTACSTSCIGCQMPGADNTIPGCCSDPSASNYNLLATCDDGSCLSFIYGCTDPTALNYYAGANIDDGTCYYPTWDCINGVCTDNFLGTGTYNSWSACDAACVLPPESWDCINGTCVDGGATGAYNSLPQCQNLCASTVQSTYNCSGYSGMMNGSTGYSSVYIPPYTCFETLDGSGNPIPPGSTGIYSPGPYLSMNDCLNDTGNTCAVTSSADNWLCHAGGCTPTNMSVNTIAGIFATLSACQTACSYSPCPDFTASNYWLEVNDPSIPCTGYTYASWNTTMPQWQTGNSWEIAITNDSTGAWVIGTAGPVFVVNGGGTSSLSPGNYTATITYTLVSGEVCVYTFPIIISCIGY